MLKLALAFVLMAGVASAQIPMHQPVLVNGVFCKSLLEAEVMYQLSITDVRQGQKYLDDENNTCALVTLPVVLDEVLKDAVVANRHWFLYDVHLNETHFYLIGEVKVEGV